MRNNLWVILILLVFLSLSGCGKDTEERVSVKTRPGDTHNIAGINTAGTNTAYKAETLTVPHEMIYCEAVYKNYLYYIVRLHAGDNTSEGDMYLVRIDLDNTATPVISRLDITVAADPDITEPYVNMTIDNNQTVHILIYHYSSKSSDAVVMNATWYQADENGNINKTLDVEHVFKPISLFGVGDFAVDGDGNGYIVYGNAIKAISSDGSKTFDIAIDGFHSLFMDREGKVNCHYDGNSDHSNIIAAINFTDQAIEGDTDIGLGGFILDKISSVSSEHLFIADTENVYGYNLADNIKTERFSWDSVGIAVNNYDRALSLPDGRIIHVRRESMDSPTVYQLIRPMTAAEQEEAELAAAEAAAITEETEVSVITLGVRNYHTGIKQAVIDFNKANPDKYIEVIDYGMGMPGSPEEEESILRLHSDIVSGKCPDIVYLPGEISRNLYASLGVFQDLNPYLEAESAFDWLNEGDILQKFEMEGKLYFLPLNYHLQALAVRTSDIGDKKEWNMDELIAYADSFDNDPMLFMIPTKTAVMNSCLMANGDTIIDWNSEDKDFNYDLVKKVLEFANRFIDDDIFAASQPDLRDIRAQKGDLRIVDYILQSHDFYETLLGEPVSYIGYPSENGSGILLNAFNYMALSTNCQDNEAAWSFISKFLYDTKPEAQSGHGDGYVYKAESVFLSEPIEYIVNEDDRADYFALRERAEVQITDLQIEKIIKEEAAAYFSGDKPLDDVVDIIESRISIYVMENQ